MSNRPCHSVATALYVATVMLAGCAGAAAPAGAKSADVSPGPATIEEAQAELERARVELAAGGPKSESAPSSVAPAAPSPQPTPSTAAPDVTSTTGGASAAERMQPAPECANRCRAIASMRRAVSAICRMAGDEDTRCTDAKKVLQDSEARVATCGC